MFQPSFDSFSLFDSETELTESQDTKIVLVDTLRCVFFGVGKDVSYPNPEGNKQPRQWWFEAIGGMTNPADVLSPVESGA